MSFADSLKKQIATGRDDIVIKVIQALKERCLAGAEQGCGSISVNLENPQAATWRSGLRDFASESGSVDVLLKSEATASLGSQLRTAISKLGLRGIKLKVNTDHIICFASWAEVQMQVDSDTFAGQLQKKASERRNRIRAWTCNLAIQRFKEECKKQAAAGLSCARYTAEFSQLDWDNAVDIKGNGLEEGRDALTRLLKDELAKLGLDNVTFELATAQKKLRLHHKMPPLPGEGSCKNSWAGSVCRNCAICLALVEYKAAYHVHVSARAVEIHYRANDQHDSDVQVPPASTCHGITSRQ